MQIYNLGIDDKSKQNGATIQYEITNLATNKSVLSLTELTNKLNPNADQVTLEKSMPLASLQPGRYQGEHQGERRREQPADRAVGEFRRRVEATGDAQHCTAARMECATAGGRGLTFWSRPDAQGDLCCCEPDEDPIRVVVDAAALGSVGRADVACVRAAAGEL